MNNKHSKSELRRQARKLRIKKRRKSNQVIIIDVSTQSWLKLKSPMINFVFAGFTLFTLFFIFNGNNISSTLNKIENNKNIQLALNLNSEKLNIAQAKSNINDAFGKEILEIVKDTPMEAMVDDISKRDKPVAAFLVGIALKESKFGIHSPKKDGADCYNYWGYRGKENPTQSGYSCFSSHEEAVKIVGNRIEAIIQQGAKTPTDMVVWKCGYSCAAFSEESVNKWIADVGINYYKLNPKEEIAKK